MRQRGNIGGQLRSILQRNSELALFSGYIDLDQNRNDSVMLGSFLLDRSCQLLCIDGMNHIDVTGDIFHLVSLQVADHVPADVFRKVFRFAAELLNVIFSEIPLSGVIERHDVGLRLCLADCKNRDSVSRSSGPQAGSLCALLYLFQIMS